MKLASKKLALTFFGLFVGVALVGCEEKGPVQKAGEGVDNAAKDIKDSVDPRGPAEKAGDKVDKVLNK